VLKVWLWHTGRSLYSVAIEEVVRPFIAVRRSRPKRGYDSDGERKPPTRRWLARQRRRQAKAAALAVTAGSTPSENPEAEEAEELELEVANEDEDEDDEEGKDENGDDVVEEGATPATPSGELEEPSAAVLVVQRIETLKVDECLVVVFSAVGATALFWFPLPLDPNAVSDGVLVVHAHDLGRPIVAFAPVAGSLDCVWVSLDAHWNNEGSSPDVVPHVRLIRLGRDSASEVSPPPPLLSTLNGASVISAEEREFSKLQLYEPLTSLPKNIDATHNPMIRDAPDSDGANGKGSRSAKAAGKMRTRMALLARGVQDEPRAKKAKGEEIEEREDAMDES